VKQNHMQNIREVQKILGENLSDWYWAEGVEVMCNFGDTRTFTFCMCRNNQEAKQVAKGLNLLDRLENE
jgi:hypothetical protein